MKDTVEFKRILRKATIRIQLQNKEKRKVWRRIN